MARTRSAMKTKAPRRTPTTVSGPGGRRASISAPNSATRRAIWAAEMSSRGGEVGTPPRCPERAPLENLRSSPSDGRPRWNLAPPAVVPKTDERGRPHDQATLGAATDASLRLRGQGEERRDGRPPGAAGRADRDGSHQDRGGQGFDRDAPRDLRRDRAVRARRRGAAGQAVRRRDP